MKIKYEYKGIMYEFSEEWTPFYPQDGQRLITLLERVSEHTRQRNYLAVMEALKNDKNSYEAYCKYTEMHKENPPWVSVGFLTHEQNERRRKVNERITNRNN